jgi:putative acetyltransferase
MMALVPAQQRRGIGAVVVLGHPECNRRFGFSSAVLPGFGCQHDVPEEAFMVMALESGYLRAKAGAVRYHAAFANA